MLITVLIAIINVAVCIHQLLSSEVGKDYIHVVPVGCKTLGCHSDDHPHILSYSIKFLPRLRSSFCPQSCANTPPSHKENWSDEISWASARFCIT